MGGVGEAEVDAGTGAGLDAAPDEPTPDTARDCATELAQPATSRHADATIDVAPTTLRMPLRRAGTTSGSVAADGEHRHRSLGVRPRSLSRLPVSLG
jgi:hypothetical protein